MDGKTNGAASLQDLLAKATPGPWRVELCNNGEPSGAVRTEDAALIALAPTLAQAVIDAVDRLEQVRLQLVYMNDRMSFSTAAVEIERLDATLARLRAITEGKPT